MFTNIVFHSRASSGSAAAQAIFFFSGMILILFGILIALFPELLVAMIAGSFIATGVICLLIAFRTRATRQRYSNRRDEVWESL